MKFIFFQLFQCFFGAFDFDCENKYVCKLERFIAVNCDMILDLEHCLNFRRFYGLFRAMNDAK